MRFFVRLSDIKKIPRGYGLCWDFDNRRDTIFAPIPLNYILGFFRNFFLYLRGGYRDRVSNAYVDGFMHGLEFCRKHAGMSMEKIVLDFKEGVEAFRKEMDAVRRGVV